MQLFLGCRQILSFYILRLFINKPLNLSSLPISNFKRSVFELTLSKILISTNLPSLAIKGSGLLIKKNKLKKIRN